MSDMVLLAIKDGSRLATVACPICGRISCKTLMNEYKSSSVAAFRISHTCPVCGTSFCSSSFAESAKYATSYSCYNSQGVRKYNSDIETAYSRTRSTGAQVQHASPFVSAQTLPSTPASEDRIMICNVTFPKSSRIYSYISDDMTIKANDIVVVPAGSDNVENVVTVISTDFYTQSSAPYPVEKTKHIIRKATIPEKQLINQDVGRHDTSIISLPIKRAIVINEAVVQKSSNNDSNPTQMPSIIQQGFDSASSPKATVSPNNRSSNEVILKRKVDSWKNQLLDLTKRNKMINYRESKRTTLKILEPKFTELFNRLAVSEEELTFQSPIDKNSDLRMFSILSLLEILSYPISVQDGDIKAEGSLIERRIALSNLRSKSKLARDEQGTNILFLSFGFIEWKEDNSANAQVLKSPLLLMPVSLKQASIKAPYTLLRYDDIEVNPTLEYYLSAKYGIDLPTFTLSGKESIVEYMKGIEEIVDQNGWKLVPEVSLGLLSFLKISMYHDLNNNFNRMLTNTVVRAITGDASAVGNIPSELDIDRVSPNDCHQVVNSDSSQQEAILLSKKGVSFVMQGPPGTGKSQTITNIIAEALADGKKILFVSEKVAALQVVYKRLTEVGLDAFCLALHSLKANKKMIVDSIAANLKLPRKSVDDNFMFELNELFQERQDLNQYVTELHEEILPLEKSLYSAFGELSNLQDTPLIPFFVESPFEVSKTAYNTMLYRVDKYAKALKPLGIKISENPWNNTVVKRVTRQFKEDFEKSADGLTESLLELNEELSVAIASFGLNESCTWNGAQRSIALLNFIENTPLFPYEWAKSEERSSLLVKAKKQQKDKQEYLNALNAVLAHFNKSVFSVNLPYWLDEVLASVEQINSIVEQPQISANDAVERATEFHAYIADVIDRLRKIASAFDKGISIMPIALYESLSGIKSLAKILLLVLNSPKVIPEWFMSDGIRIAKSAVPTAKEHIALLTEAKSQIASVWDNNSLLSIALKYRHISNKIVGELNTFQSTFSHIAKLYPIVDSKNISFYSMAIFYKNATELLESPRVLRQWFDRKACKKIKAIFPDVISHSSKLIGLEEWLHQNNWEERASNIDAESMLHRFKMEYYFPPLKYLISSYHTDIKMLRGVSKKIGSKPSIEEITSMLHVVLSINEEKNWFASKQAELKGFFGDLYTAHTSNWKEIARGIEFVETVRTLFPQGNVPERVIDIVCNKNLYAFELSELAALLPALNENSITRTKESIASLGLTSHEDIQNSLLPQFMGIEKVSNELIELLTEHPNVSELGHASLKNLISILKETQKLKLSFDDIDISEILRLIINLNIEIKWLDEHNQLLWKSFGGYYSGETTDWNAICEGIAYAEQISRAFPKPLPESVIAILCDKATHEKECEELSKVLFELSEDKQRVINEAVSKVFGDCSYQGIKEELILKLNLLNEQNGKLINLIALMSEHISNEMPLSDLIIRVSEADRVNKTRISLEKTYSSYKEFFGARMVGVETDWNSIISDLESVSVLSSIKEAHLMKDSFIASFCEDAGIRAKLSETNSKLQHSVSECIAGYSNFRSLFSADSDFDNAPISAIANKVVGCLESIMLLDDWISYVEARNACNEMGLDDFTEKVEQQDKTIDDVVAVFKRRFLMMWIQSVIGSRKAVDQFRRSNHDEKIKRFSCLDEKRLLAAQERIRQKVINRIPAANHVLPANDELSILKRETGKTRKIMPLRKLFKSIPNLLLKLKPCMMMSPLSVAYFLEADSYEFDMVIFDEASQIFPQDAIGSILRGRQLIIAGDSKQLPPTNFFAASASNDDRDFDEDNDEAEGTELYDSILEETARVLPNRTLLWHYRSKHENLIAFSNQEIYENELVTFPGSKNNGVDNGVEFIFVESGTYEGKGRNTSEARRCVELVKYHIDKTPNRSLGIIAFSESQQKAIALEIQKFREQHPEYESYFIEDKEDEFFVKNLENVQGDERDTIILSVSYAKTKEQRDNNRPMALRFGPLGQPGGERRLNVAITRAKYNVKLVSSIKPSDIDLSRTKSEGVKMLRQYMDFAIDSSSLLRIGQVEAEKDLFLDVVAKYLISHGYEIKKQVGCSDYKVDLAVLHPHVEDCYVAGIELDGFSYASAKSAGDRDHLRKSVLESMGWRLYRVWSPEWVAQQDIEGEKLLHFVEVAIREYEEMKNSASPEQTIQLHKEPFAEGAQVRSCNESSSPITSTDARPNNPYGFSEYKKAAWNETPRYEKFFGDDRLAEEIKYIVGIEQPIYIDLLYQRLSGAFGKQKATSTVHKAVDRVMRGSKLKGQIERDNDGFVTLVGFKDLKARIPAAGDSSREINCISLDEIGIAMLAIAAQEVEMTSGRLIDATAKALGYARKGDRMMTCMKNALERLLKQGRIKLVDEKIVVIGSDHCE
ncbi:MAG: DUF4011 domain-containing protein [Clostridiales bacterium]|jgi:very-short-patch-repair endonuclease|nr:DUF4011 domain-containing protein [Clostridiales bacterium]